MAEGRIETIPGVMGGKPIIRGTRIPVEVILRECVHGSPEYVADLFPRLTVEDVQAALAYAADRLANAHPHAAE